MKKPIVVLVTLLLGACASGLKIPSKVQGNLVTIETSPPMVLAIDPSFLYQNSESSQLKFHRERSDMVDHPRSKTKYKDYAFIADSGAFIHIRISELGRYHYWSKEQLYRNGFKQLPYQISAKNFLYKIDSVELEGGVCTQIKHFAHIDKYDAHTVIEIKYGEVRYCDRLMSNQQNIRSFSRRAQHTLGIATSYKFDQNDPDALKKLRLAAALDYAPAQFKLAQLHEVGRLIEQNSDEALRLYQRASEGGSDEADFTLGNLYERGQLVAVDRSRALEHYQRAAKAGNIGATLRLATIYEQGEWVAQDVSKAIDLYRQISERSATARSAISAICSGSPELCEG